MFGSWRQFGSNVLARILLIAAIAATGGAVLGACAGQIPHPTPAQADLAAKRWPGINIARLEESRNLYVAKCSGCHGLRRPDDYRAEKWSEIMEEMKGLAKITDDEKDSILQYVLSVKMSD